MAVLHQHLSDGVIGLAACVRRGWFLEMQRTGLQQVLPPERSHITVELTPQLWLRKRRD